MKTFKELKQEVINDPTVHNWVKDAIVKLDDHDIVDVLLDVGILHKLFHFKWEEIKEAAKI
jgi:hypothetical protein